MSQLSAPGSHSGHQTPVILRPPPERHIAAKSPTKPLDGASIVSGWTTPSGIVPIESGFRKLAFKQYCRFGSDSMCSGVQAKSGWRALHAWRRQHHGLILNSSRESRSIRDSLNFIEGDRVVATIVKSGRPR